MAANQAGIDFGGSKIAIVVIAADRTMRLRRRIPTPSDNAGAIAAIVALVEQAEEETGSRGMTIGVGLTGRIDPRTGIVRSSNCLNGHPFQQDITAMLARPVRIANDANCFALSEAVDGAGRGALIVFGVVLGNGCGGGIVLDGRLLEGPNGVSAEWGHNPFLLTRRKSSRPALLVRPVRLQ